jgi:hypothetical protein
LRGAGAASSCARCALRGAALHVVARFHEVLDARRHERRSGGALCAAQRMQRLCVLVRAGTAGCSAQRRRRTPAPHVAPR